MKILFRADGGEGIGLGHIMRTLVLAKEMAKYHDVKYICSNKNIYKSGIEKIKEENIDVITIDKHNELNEVKDISGDLIVVDKYDIDEKYLKNLKEKFKVAYFDDNNDLDFYPVDIIINQNLHGEILKYNTLDETTLLLGRKYTMLREEFRNTNPITINREIKNVLITVGGSDDFNITESILKQFKDFNFNVHVVIGPAFKYKEVLYSYKQKNIILYEQPNMSELMRKVDVAISSCGSTLYELSCLGIPTIGIIVADNQYMLGQYVNKLNCILLSTINNLSEDINQLTYQKRLDLSINVKKLVDGKGVFRVKKVIENTIIN